MAEATVSSGINDEEIYERLFHYEFQDNSKFLEGWRKIVNIVTKSQKNDSLIKAQVFFYSREVEPVDLACYKQWLTDNNKIVRVPDLPPLSEDNQENSSLNDSGEPCETQTVNSSEALTGNHPKNFAELIAMVQSGVPLPDTENLNIEPTNDEPSSPVMQRPKKPWEMHVEN